MERVEEVINSVNGLLARGMDWGDIEKLIESERKRGNPVAEIISKCNFKEGKVVLGLHEEEGDSDEDDEGQIVDVEIDLGLSAWANTREYFEKKKVAAEKVSPSNLVSNFRNQERHSPHQKH
jgi:hypothetical protein